MSKKDWGVLEYPREDKRAPPYFLEDGMSFEELIKKISPKLRRITFKLSRYLTVFSADDLYQEALIRLWNDFSKGKLQDNTDSYILQGCYFHLKNYLRTHKNNIILVSLDEAVHDEEGQDLDLSNCISLATSRPILDDIHVKFLLEQINNNGLTKREKEIFHFTLDGLTTRQIGERLGISHVRVVKIQKVIRQKCLKHVDVF